MTRRGEAHLRNQFPIDTIDIKLINGIVFPEVSMSTPCYAMSLEQFSRQAIAVTVTPVMGEGGKVRLMPSSPQAEAALEEFQREFLRAGMAAGIKDADVSRWVVRKMDELLSNVFSDDLWYGRIPDGRPVILVKEEPAQLHGLNAVLRKTHLNEVLDAARSDLEIPPAVAEEYSWELSQMFAQRNLPVS